MKKSRPTINTYGQQECWDNGYNQGREDCLREAHRFAEQESYKEGFKRGLEQGKAEMIKEFLTKLCTCIPFVSLEDEIACRKIFFDIAEQLKE